MSKKFDLKLVISGIMIATYSIVFYLLISRFDQFKQQVNWILVVVRPLIYAIGLSYILNLAMSFIEEKLLVYTNLGRTKKRALAILLALAFFVLVITVILMFVIPQLWESISVLFANFPYYMRQLVNWANTVLEKYDIDLTLQYINTLPWQSYVNKALEWITSSFTNIFQTTLGTTLGISEFLLELLLAISLSMYLLSDKEKLIFQMKKAVMAIFHREIAVRILNISKVTNQTIRKYLSGQLVEAFVLGLLCFAGMVVLRLPYAMLLSVIIGVTALVPVIGPTIGNLICAFLLLVIKPMHALVFFIYINVLQQIDNSFIYPKIVGESIGLSGLWVLLAIIVGGKLFGLFGIILGVPIMAVLYNIGSDVINYLLVRKNITDDDIN